MSVILDALRKSEHERQRGAVPGLAQVPTATPRAELPRWALVVISVLGAAVLLLGGAWLQSLRGPVSTMSVPATASRADEAPESAAAIVPPARPSAADPRAPASAPPVVMPSAESSAAPAPALETSTPSGRAVPPSQSLADAVAPAARSPAPVTSPPPAQAENALARPPAARDAPASSPPETAVEPTLPSATALMAQGVSLPPLKLELHAYAAEPSARFVFINGRKYVEGQRLAEGPEVAAIAPNGAVLTYLGQRFLLAPE